MNLKQEDIQTRTLNYNNINVTVYGQIEDEEIFTYLNQAQAKAQRKILTATITVDGNYIDLRTKLDKIPFERIRRITGYLVGTTDRWNNAKRAEEKDRIKHIINR